MIKTIWTALALLSFLVVITAVFELDFTGEKPSSAAMWHSVTAHERFY